ncbi:MAG TPA: Maf family protein [Kiritimatiellia bacterium]|nr:Maf family protein [Kiritimatiellia bacterium]
MAESNSGNRPLVLASASPRRRGFLHQLGYAFEVVTPATEEKARSGESAPDYVRRNAAEKAADVAARATPGAVVIAADTVVVLRGRIMEKPRSEAEACAMLRSLGGQVHQVVTGFCVRGPGPDGAERVHARTVSTDVEFKELAEAEIAAYVRSGEPMDKAGAYAIQGRAAYMIRQIRGSYTNVVGLPLTELVETLANEFGVAPTFHGPAGA